MANVESSESPKQRAEIGLDVAWGDLAAELGPISTACEELARQVVGPVEQLLKDSSVVADLTGGKVPPDGTLDGLFGPRRVLPDGVIEGMFSGFPEALESAGLSSTVRGLLDGASLSVAEAAAAAMRPRGTTENVASLLARPHAIRGRVGMSI